MYFTIGTYNKEDIAASVVHIWASGLVSYLSSYARSKGCHQVVFNGSMVQSPGIRDVIMYALTLHNMHQLKCFQEVLLSTVKALILVCILFYEFSWLQHNIV